MIPNPARPDEELLRLKGVLDPPSPDALSDLDASRQAAVSLILRVRGDAEILLIKRADSERDPWSGHMALPGGRRDSRDASLLATAIRETAEEVGVHLDRESSLLGQLKEVQPSRRSKARLTIQPFVFGVPAHTEARATSHEVAHAFWVSLRSLRDPGLRGTTTAPTEAGSREFPALLLEGEVIWGLTYRILNRFLAQIEGL